MEGEISWGEVLRRHSTDREHAQRLRSRKNRMLKARVGERVCV